MASNRPPRTVRPSQKLNQDNIGELELASHKNFVEAARSDPKHSHEPSIAAPSTQAPTVCSASESVPEAEPARSNPRKRRVPSSPVESERGRPSTHNNDSDNNSSDNDESQAMEPQRKPAKPKKKKKKTAHSKHTRYLLPYYD